MSLREFLSGRRVRSSKEQKNNRSCKYRPELRDAWLAFETGYSDNALELATPYLDSNDSILSAEAKKLIALIHFRDRDYQSALALFSDVVAVHNSAGNWFNVCTAATLSGDIQSGEHAFRQLLKAKTHRNELSIPVMRYYYASALRDRGEFAKALDQINELRSIYEMLKVTDDNFVAIRGVPFLSHTMDLAVDVFRGLGASVNGYEWIEKFANNLDQEGREYLHSIQLRLIEQRR